MNDIERNEPVKYRISKAKTTLKEVNILIENKLYKTAINRTYLLAITL